MSPWPAGLFRKRNTANLGARLRSEMDARGVLKSRARPGPVTRLFLRTAPPALRAASPIGRAERGAATFDRTLKRRCPQSSPRAWRRNVITLQSQARRA